MGLQRCHIKRLWHFLQVIGLAVLFLWLGSFSLTNFTAKPGKRPIYVAPALAGPPVSSPSGNPQPHRLSTANPVTTAFIEAIPSVDGQEVFVSAAGINAAESSIVLNVDPGVGGGAHKGGYAMTLSGTTYIATAIGFAPGQDVGSDGDDTMSITTTVGSEVMSSGEINFQRAFVETTQPEMISVDNNDFILEVVNAGTVSIDTYVLVMSTNTPPGALPLGYQFAGSAYNVRPSGALTQSDKSMILNLGFQEPLPQGNDPHTLKIVGWDALNKKWDILGGDLLDNDDMLTLGITRFRIYALATTPIWRDSFYESSLSGVAERINTGWGPGETIILSSGATTGTVTSIPITPTNAASWSTLHFSATTSLSAGLTVDVLDTNDNLVLNSVSDGADLSALSLETYPSLKLRATLTRSLITDESPKLREWQVAWLPQVYDVYLPLVIKDGS